MVARRVGCLAGVSRLSVSHTLTLPELCTVFATLSPPKWRLSHPDSVREPLLDLLMPRQCVACSLPGLVLCAGCRIAVRAQSVVTVESGVCAVSDPLGIGRAVVRGYKVGGHRSLAPLIAESLARAVRQSLQPRRWVTRVALVPVPQRRQAMATRGFDSTSAIARQAAKTLRVHGLACDVVQGVRYARQPGDQRGLGIVERHLNVTGSMRLRGKAIAQVCGEQFSIVVAVDDVVTTGATLAELRRSLVAVGARSVCAAAAFSTPRLAPPYAMSPG